MYGQQLSSRLLIDKALRLQRATVGPLSMSFNPQLLGLYLISILIHFEEKIQQTNK